MPHSDYRILVRTLDTGVLHLHVGETTTINTAPYISEVIEVTSDVLLDFLIGCGIDAMRRVVDDIPPGSIREELSPITMLVSETTPARVAVDS